jgi:flagellin
MRINTNVSALQSSLNLGRTQDSVTESMAKLSSGFRINRAADDAAGLGIANKLRADTRAMTQASRNAEQANSVLQIAEGAASSVQSILERMKELATEAASDNVDDAGRTKIHSEFDQLRQEVARIAATTKFQGKALLDGTFGNSVAVAGSSAVNQAGTVLSDVKLVGAAAGAYTLTNANAGTLTLANATTTQSVAVSGSGKQSVSFSQFGISIELNNAYTNGATNNVGGGVISVAAGSGGGTFMVSSSGSYTSNDLISLSSIDLTTASSGLNLGGLSLSSASGAQAALSTIDSAMTTVSSKLGDIGALQNRIGYAMSNIKTSIVNYAAAESVIRDVDMADEMTKFSKNQILSQAGTAMLAQANQSAQGILQLLR